MNKKTLITIIVVPLVLFLIAGIIGASFIFAPKDISVTGVSFTSEGIQTNDNGKILYLDLDTATSWQLKWAITPSDATNKDVTFSFDGSDKISVDQNGKVTVNATNQTDAPIYAGKVTITTADSEKQDTMMLKTKTSVPQKINYNYETNAITTSSQVLYDAENKRYQIFADRNYQLFEEDAAYTIDIGETDVVELMLDSENNYQPNSIRPIKAGTFTLTVNKAEESPKTLEFEVVNNITYIGLPTALDIAEKPEKYYIGSQNNYYFDYLIDGGLLFVNLEVLKDGEVLQDNALSAVASVKSAREVKFTSEAVGNEYTIRASYILDSSINTSYTFSVIDAWNVRNHEELSKAFNDGADQKSSIVVTDNINITEADLPSNFLDHGKNKTSYSTTTDGWKGIYTRYADLTLEGNHHKISASSVGFFAKVEENGDDKFGHERPSVFHIAKYDSNGKNETAYKEFYWCQEFKTMASGIGDDPTYTNTSTPERLPIREQQATYVKSLYNDENTTIPKVYINNLNLEGNGGKNVVNNSEDNQYMGFRVLCGIKVNGAKLYVKGCTIEKFLDGVKGDRALSITVEDCNVGNMSGFDVYAIRTRFVTIKNSTMGEAGHVAVLHTPQNSDTYVDQFTIYEGVYNFSKDNGTHEGDFYDSQTGIPKPDVTTDGAVETNGQVLKLVGDVIFNNWFNLKGPFLEHDKKSFAAAQQVKTFMTTVLGAKSSIIFKNYSEETKDDALLNYAIQLECVGGGANYTYLDRSELNSESKFTSTYDASTFHKLVLNATKGLKLEANINNSRLNSELMCVGANFHALQQGGSNYLTTLIVGINKDSNFHLA